jgi:hypothetical protein
MIRPDEALNTTRTNPMESRPDIRRQMVKVVPVLDLIHVKEIL